MERNRARASSTPTQRWVLALTSLASLMVMLDIMVVTTALTTIRQHLGASIEELEWTINAYTLSFAVLLMTAAALADLATIAANRIQPAGGPPGSPSSPPRAGPAPRLRTARRLVPPGIRVVRRDQTTAGFRRQTPCHVPP